MDLVEDFRCSCALGFEGKFCEINRNDCESNPCEGAESYCYDLVNNYECKCQAGLEGRNCELNVDECALGPCHHGTCQDGIGDYTCHCKPGYSGRNCSQVRHRNMASAFTETIHLFFRISTIVKITPVSREAPAKTWLMTTGATASLATMAETVR